MSVYRIFLSIFLSGIEHLPHWVLLWTCDLCVCVLVFTILWHLLCFHFAGFDSTVCWAVGEWALQRRFHVFFYVRLKSCRGRYLRGLLSVHRLNVNPGRNMMHCAILEPFSCAVNPGWFTLSDSVFCSRTNQFWRRRTSAMPVTGRAFEQRPSNHILETITRHCRPLRLSISPYAWGCSSTPNNTTLIGGVFALSLSQTTNHQVLEWIKLCVCPLVMLAYLASCCSLLPTVVN